VTRLPTIGITVSLDPAAHPSARVPVREPRLRAAVRDAGALPLLVPPDADAARGARGSDGFGVTGGGMLPTALAGGVAAPESVGAAEQCERIAWDRRLLDCARA
jgi:hypothetical protein